MANYKFSKEADKDLVKIYEYTILNFGYSQAKTYSQNLYSKIQSLANKQIKGRKADIIQVGLRRIEVGSYIILYNEEPNVIFIVRILHNNMDIRKHIFEDNMYPLTVSGNP